MSNYSIFPKRPNKNDDEDELLRQSKEFDKSTSAAKLVKVQTNKTSSSAKDIQKSAKKSRFAQSRKKSDLKRVHEEASQYQKPNLDTNNAVLKDSVVEKMILPHPNNEGNMEEYSMDVAVPEPTTKKPFPEAMMWNKDITTPKITSVQGTKKKLSIFAQQLLHEGRDKQKIESEMKMSTPMVVVDSHERNWGPESRLFKGANLKAEDSKLITEIHKENVMKLNSMSEEQILTSKKELMDKVDPLLLEFLMNKNKKYAKATVNSNEKHASGNEDTMQTNIERNINEKRPFIGSSSNIHTSNNDISSEKKDVQKIKPNTEPQKYLNMDRIEKDKMEWMSDINETDQQNKIAKESFNARFNFDGCLLPYKDSSIPVTAALHHHGDEPDRPGYTLEELLTLARSINPKQRSIAFDTLSLVIKNAKDGRFDFCFGMKSEVNTDNEKKIRDNYVNVLVELLEADLVTILRLTIDESAHTSALVLDSSVNCLAQIIDNHSEEMALDKQFFVSFETPHQPYMKTKICSEPDFIKDEKEMKDIQILKSDLVLGLLRMDILDRFTYLLSVTKPSNPTILNILKIISRMCRHSMQTVSTIVNHSNLISVIIDNFLPSRTVVHNPNNVYNTPVHFALKIIRIIMAWGRGFCSEILDKFDLTSRLLAYCALVPGESSNPVHHVQESLQLTIEAYRCWITCLEYGLMVNAFIDFHPVIMKHMLYLKSKLSLHSNSGNEKDKFDFDYGVAFLKVIECAMRCIPCENIDSFTVVDKEVAHMTPLGWEYFTGASGIMEIIQDCLRRWIVELSRNDQISPKHYHINIVASCFKLLSTFVKRFSRSTLFKPVTFLNTLDEIIKHINTYMYQSKFLSNLISKTNELSIFSEQDGKDGRIRDPNNLPSLGVIRYGGNVLGILTEQSPFGFLNAYVSLIISSLQVNKGLFDNAYEKKAFLENVLNHQGIQKYMELASKHKDLPVKTNWFAKPELSILFKIVLIDCLYLQTYEGNQIWTLAASLVQHLQVGQEYELSFLLKNILFASRYINSVNHISHQLSQLNVREKNDSTGDQKLQIDNNAIWHISSNWEEKFPKIENLYRDLLLPNSKVLKQSEFRHHQLCYSTSSLTIKSKGETILPTDWQYLPLLTVMQQRQSDTAPNSKFSTDKSSDEKEVANVRDCLLWLYVTNIHTKCEKTISSLQISIRFSRLSTVFLAAPDLFMDDQIYCLLKHCLHDTIVHASKRYKDGFKFHNNKIPGIDSFKEYYEELINQFEAVSYGNELFSLVLLIPLTASNSWEYRSVFWCDHQNNLRLITLKEDQLPHKVMYGELHGLTIQNFVVKNEKHDLIRSYIKHIINANITKERNPLLFEIARANVVENMKNDEKLHQEVDLLLKSLPMSNELHGIFSELQ